MKILNFGSINIDYVYSVDHFVQAGETQSTYKREVFPGGKGLNQSIALSKADVKVYHAGKIGKHDGQFLKELLIESNVNAYYVKDVESPSGHTIIQVNKEGNNCILLYPGANDLQDVEFVNEVFDNFGSNDYLVLQNEINNMDLIVEKAHEKNMKIFLNPSPFNEKIETLNLNHIDYFLLNEIEASLMCNENSDDINILINKLRKKYPNAKFVLTLGKDGVIYFDSESIYSHGIYDVEVVDTTAAGDTFTGYFIASISKGLDIEKTLELASIASSISVTKNGAALSIPSLNEVLNSNLNKN
ncbi:MAG: ribokinase [Pleomorphochaeta sp.]